MATMLPLACHAALKLWAEAVRMLKRAEDDLALFEAQYKEKVTCCAYLYRCIAITGFIMADAYIAVFVIGPSDHTSVCLHVRISQSYRRGTTILMLCNPFSSMPFL